MKRNTKTMNKGKIKKSISIFAGLLALAVGAAAQSPKDSKPASREKPVNAIAVPSNIPDGITKDQAEAILLELRQIRQLLEKQQTPPTRVGAGQNVAPALPEKVEMNFERAWYSVGRADAPVTIVEFADLQCPFCKRFHMDVYAELKKSYIDSGKVRFVSRDLPLDFHPFALRAAEAARCAGDQGKYWEVREALFANASPLDERVIQKSAEELSLDMNRFGACLDSHKYKRDIQKDAQEAATLQINGTPTFVVARTAGDRLEGVRIVGARPLATFQSAIDGLLKAE
jgi:protein-disulfide isomerase